MRIRAPKDFWSGVMFCGFAAVAISAAHGYSLGIFRCCWRYCWRCSERH
jgi:hypothetical protein